MRHIKAKNIEGGFKIAIVVSRFNEDVTEKLLQGAVERLKELEFQDHQITIATVPGAVEIPVTAQRFAMTKQYQAIVCLGAVIRGETAHFDFVCEHVNQGCLRVALDHHVPVIFGVITPDTKEQALARAGGKRAHKGRDAIDTAYEMVSVLRQVE